MKHKLVIPAAVAALGLIATASNALATTDTTDTQVREDDLVSALQDVRSAGHYDFLAEGVHVYTDDATSNAKVALYFPVTDAFPASGGIEWYGTPPAPGAQLVFDADDIEGNGNDYNILVGEPTTYGENWWLTNGSSADAKAVDPSGADDGGNGSQWFGTLAQWKAALPDATVLAGGFSLGSGIKGDGVVRSVTLGSTSYVFTDTPAVVTKDVTGDVEAKLKKNRRVKLVFSADPLPDGTTQGDALAWEVVVDDETEAEFSQNAGQVARLGYRFDRFTGNHKIVVLKNGTKVETVKVRTGKDKRDQD